ncbi:protein-glutamine gamma-glutamyltransferase 2-like isoform X2 [Carcharodon carcharias]|uniref:protein-glutamine gamma-glutamyltransferase 2-like isoform X2 n=1 Tax=Carcharodon carcharias TaxID=13397 RepID=UPI001B7DDAD9|nr:protein-glutamine gamma-glutamyltransferase 2-like isoform X2 [Carcharodon carcharias]
MAQALAVAGTDFQCEVNNKAHRTADFGSNRLIVRRGDRFTVTVHFAGRGYQGAEDQISVIVETGLAPSVTSGTKAQFPLSNSLDESKWNAALVSSAGNQLSLSICSPANAKIGHYTLKLCTTQGQSTPFDLGKFILLFNPWCSDDAVFLDFENQRKEYVLNDQGLIYQGTKKLISHIAWNFGQFEDGIVDICLKLLDNSSNCLKNQEEDCSQRHDPVYISRIVAAMVNCNDDKGILQGNWGPDYSCGVPPTMWNGSITILRRWNKLGCQPVRFGQCWVFAAVACTVLRCLGIPTRPITNFNSAHDTEQNLRIDSFIDENGKISKKSKDSVWNFHCWIESWMTRPDLKPGYDGWQVIDPTPQEKSEGIYCCGPASVKAIKSGDIDQKFDSPFVFAEVNADYVSWLLCKDGSKKQIEVNHRLVGQNISTKAVGSDEREDVTHNYKYAEGSEEEREAFTKADMKNKLTQEPEKKFFLKLKAEKVNLNGADFEVSAVLSNQTSAVKNCRLILCAKTILYNGQSIQECSWKDLAKLTIRPHEEKTETLQVHYSNYGQSLTEHNQILIVALAMEYEAGELVVTRKVITLQNPDLHIKIIGEPVQYRDLTAEIYFTNPMPVNLCNGTFLVEGAGLTDEQKVPCPVQSIKPGQEVKVRVKFTPQKPGLRKLAVDFDCNKLKDVKGFKNVIVRPANK